MENENDTNMIEQTPDVQSAATPAPVAPAPATPAVPPTKADEREQEIARLRQLVDELKAELDGTQDALATERLTTVVRQASQTTPKLNIAAQDLRRDKAIAAAGHLARWNQLPIASRFKAIGETRVPTDADFVEAAKVFGPNASGAAAQSLARTNPQRYLFLRLCHIEKR